MKINSKPSGISTPTYNSILKDISQIYETAQSDGTKDWNKANLYSNWKIGERIIQVEQGREERAAYGDKVLKQLSKDLNRKFGKGFSDRNLRYMRKFYQIYKLNQIQYALNWTQYRILLLVEDGKLRLDLENRAIREGLSHRDLLKPFTFA